MKTVKLKIGKEEPIDGQIQILTTYGLLKGAINYVTPNSGGLNVEEMMKRLKLLGEVEKHKETFNLAIRMDDKIAIENTLKIEAEMQLEDADYEHLKLLVKNCQWSVISQFIVDLVKSFD